MLLAQLAIKLHESPISTEVKYMQVILRIEAILLCACEAEFAHSTYPAAKADSHVSANLGLVRADAAAETQYTTNAFMATNMGQFNIGYGLAVRTRRSSPCGMQVYGSGP